MPAPTSHRPRAAGQTWPNARTRNAALRDTRRLGDGGGPSRKTAGTGEKFSARRALRRAGFGFADEARGMAADTAQLGRGLERIGAGDFTGSAGGLAVAIVGGILGLLLLDLLVSSRGASIAGAGLRWSGGALQRLVSPSDPLTRPGSSTTSTPSAPAPATATGKAPANRSPGTSTRTSWGADYGGPLYPTPAGRLVPIPGAAGHTVDAAYSGFVGWIERQFGVVATSGYRDPAANAAAGGAPGSDHLRGLAVDFGGSAAAMERLYRWALGFGFPYVESPAQAVAAGEGPHVHISFFRPSTSTP